MYFRFGVAILLAVAVSVLGVTIEKSTFEFRREISRQQYRKDVLREEQQRLRLQTQELGAPTRILDPNSKQHNSAQPVVRSPNTHKSTKRRPLLRWQRRGGN